MSMAVHPNFAMNHFVYIVYTKPLPDNKRTSAVARARYVDGRLVDTTDVWVADDISGPTAVTMTPDAKLWIGIVGGNGNVAQDPMTLAGKVIRLNDDGTVPRDNPFVGKEGYRPEIYTMGHRTSMGLAVQSGHPGSVPERDGSQRRRRNQPARARDATTDGPLVSLGRTYPGPWQASFNEPTHHDFELPMVYWTPSISVSGLAFYNGDALPKWKGDMFVGGVRYGEIPGTGRVERVVLNENFEEMRRESLLTDLHQRIRDVKQGPDGLLYVATDEEQGAILRIEPAP